MGVSIESAGIHDLASDCQRIPLGATRHADRAVGAVARDGQKIARANARRNSGTHGKHYPRSITAERKALAQWEYGPDAAMPQGGMSFEFGSRNQPPHLDLAKSADVIGPTLAKRVGDAIQDAFWNG